jgi:hypothetical protein
MSERNGFASMSKLLWDRITSDDPPTGDLDRYGPYEIELLPFERYLDRIRFLRLRGYPLGAAIIGARRLGRDRPVYLNYMHRLRSWPSDFDPPTPSQMFARLGLLLVIALGFALLAQFLLPTH